MATPDMDVVEEIMPGYKVILKAVLKNQIQHLVDQLSSTTDEEAMVLTASLSDSSSSYLGSDFGKGFIKDQEDIKSQFLDFCRKKHRQKKGQDIECQESETLQAHTEANPVNRRSQRSCSLQTSPVRGKVSLGVRHEPYPMTRSRKSAKKLDPVGESGQSLAANSLDGQIIDLEPEDVMEASYQSGNDIPENFSNNSLYCKQSTASNADTESGSNTNDDDVGDEAFLSESSNSINEFDKESTSKTDLDSGVYSEDDETYPRLSVKLEAIAETLKNMLECDGEIAESDHDDVEIVESDHDDVEIVEPDHGDVEIAQSDHRNVEIAEPDHGNVEIAETDHIDVEIAETDHIDVEIAESHHTDVEIAEPVHGDVEIAETDHNDIEIAETDHGNVGIAETDHREAEITGIDPPITQLSINQSDSGVSMEINLDTNDIVYLDRDDLPHFDNTGTSHVLSSSFLQTHTGSVTTVSVCNKCGKSLNDSILPSEPIGNHDIVNPLQCLACSDDNSTKADSNGHTSQNNNKSSNTCRICGKWLKHKRSMNRHLAIHAGIKPFRCDKCGKRFGLKQPWQKHMLTHSSKRILFKCNICEKAYTQKHHLARHEALHHANPKPFKGDISSKVYTQKATLSLHKASDAGVKKALRSGVNKASSTGANKASPTGANKASQTGINKAPPTSVSKATLTSVNNKLFNCNICEKAYTQKSHLTRHKALHHANSKPSKCDISSKANTQKATLSTNINKASSNGVNKALPTSVNKALPTSVNKALPTSVNKALRSSVNKASPTGANKASQTGVNKAPPTSFSVNNKLFKCNICEKAYTRKSHVTRHKASSHANPKPSKGDISSKAKTQKSTLSLRSSVNKDSSTGTNNASRTGVNKVSRTSVNKALPTGTNKDSETGVNKDSPVSVKARGTCVNTASCSGENKASPMSVNKASLISVNKALRSSVNKPPHISISKANKLFKCNICGKAYTRKSHVTRHKASSHAASSHAHPKPFKGDISSEANTQRATLSTDVNKAAPNGVNKASHTDVNEVLPTGINKVLRTGVNKGWLTLVNKTS